MQSSGAEVFWSSGTWLVVAGQLLTVVAAVIIYVYQGKQERKARDQERES